MTVLRCIIAALAGGSAAAVPLLWFDDLLLAIVLVPLVGAASMPLGLRRRPVLGVPAGGVLLAVVVVIGGSLWTLQHRYAYGPIWESVLGDPLPGRVGRVDRVYRGGIDPVWAQSYDLNGYDVAPLLDRAAPHPVVVRSAGKVREVADLASPPLPMDRPLEVWAWHEDKPMRSFTIIHDRQAGRLWLLWFSF